MPLIRPTFLFPALRVIEANYPLTTYSNRVNDHQNNLRIGAGISYQFGKR